VGLCRWVGRFAARPKGSSARTTLTWEPWQWDEETGDVTNDAPAAWFSADAFRCQVCGLHLDSQAEIDACFDPVWEIEAADWHHYEPEVDDAHALAAYEKLRAGG
jgi:hypothetical protein